MWGIVHWLSEKSCKQSNLQSDELNTIQCSCRAGELKAGVEMLICERDPSSVPEHQPCNRRLPKIPLIFFECRRRVSSVEVLVWLRRWCWGCWFAMDGWGREMLGLRFHLLESRFFSFLTKLRLSRSTLSCGLQPWETYSLWITNFGEEGDLTPLSWEI